MQRISLISLAIASSLMAQGCAKSSSPAPSHLGMSLFSEAALADEDQVAETAEARSQPRPELRHVTSNKVLGAMAFQKTTGRAVDPGRLTGHD
jgi:hypothetical protein